MRVEEGQDSGPEGPQEVESEKGESFREDNSFVSNGSGGSGEVEKLVLTKKDSSGPCEMSNDTLVKMLSRECSILHEENKTLREQLEASTAKNTTTKTPAQPATIASFRNKIAYGQHRFNRQNLAEQLAKGGKGGDGSEEDVAVEAEVEEKEREGEKNGDVGGEGGGEGKLNPEKEAEIDEAMFEKNQLITRLSDENIDLYQEIEELKEIIETNQQHVGIGKLERQCSFTVVMDKSGEKDTSGGLDDLLKPYDEQ